MTQKKLAIASHTDKPTQLPAIEVARTPKSARLTDQVIRDFSDCPPVKHNELARWGVRYPLNDAISVRSARIAKKPSGRFEFSKNGLAAWVIAARDAYGEIEDLVAFRPDTPAEYACYLGAAMALACFEHPERHAQQHTPVQVHLDPLEYLRADGWGFLVLDYGRFAQVIGQYRSHGLICKSFDFINKLNQHRTPQRAHVRIMVEF